MCAHFTLWQTRAEDRVAHPPHSPTRVCPSRNLLMPALPSTFIPWGKQMYQSKHSRMESLGCLHTSGDKHIPPKSRVFLICMGHFPPASISRNEKAAAFLRRRMRSWSAFPSPRAACPTLDVLNLTSLRKPTRCWAPHGRGRPSRGI